MANSSQVFAERTWTTRLSLLGNIVLLFALIVTPYLTITAVRHDERFVILGRDGTYIVAPVVEFAEAKELHEKAVLDAVAALFMRNPLGPDRPREIPRLFTGKASDQARALIESEAAEFTANQIHQKVESLQIEIQRVSDTRVRCAITATLIRNGKFANRATTDAKKLAATFTLERNPNVYLNDQYPLTVWEFEHSYQ